MPKTVIAQCEEKMLKTIESLKKDFTNIRTGKANPAILNSVMVSYYGVPTPVSQVGSVSVPDPQSIVVKPWDKSILKDIERAIQAAGLGLNPQNDGEIVRIPIPPLNEQTRKDLAKQAKKVAEENKVAIRNVRRDAMEQLKKFYISPQILVYEINVESGFAQSSDPDDLFKIPSWEYEEF